METELNFYYSCQFCGLIFTSQEELIIEPYFYPVCSGKCKFMILKKWIELCFNDEMLKLLDSSEPFNRAEIIFSLTKRYARIKLSDFIILLSSITIKNIYQNSSDSSIYHIKPYVVGLMIDESDRKLNDKEVLQEW